MADNYRISTLNMLTTSAQLAITEGLAYDKPYLYITPHNTFVIAKVDTRSFTIVATLDLSQVSPTLTGMLGSFIAGNYLYVLPHLSNGATTFYQSDVVMVDLNNFTPAGCTTLAVLDASVTISGMNGRTDGVNGYINVQSTNFAVVTRFGLGKNFNAASIQTVTLSSVAGFPVTKSNLVAVDQNNVYSVAMCITKQASGAGHNDRQTDLFLITIPTKNFTAAAATFQRLTNVHFLRNNLPIAFDDGQNLWIPPIPIVAGPLTGKFVGVIKVPKANPAGVQVFQGPSSQPVPPTTTNCGMPVYDGSRYGYITADSAPQVVQIDTRNPGVVNLIDISAASGNYPMFGLGYDGHWAYACSFNGAGGLCLKFLPSPTVGHGNDDDQGEDGDDQGGQSGPG